MIIRNSVASSYEWQEHVYGSLPFFAFALQSMWERHWLQMVELGRDYGFVVVVVGTVYCCGVPGSLFVGMVAVDEIHDDRDSPSTMMLVGVDSSSRDLDYSQVYCHRHVLDSVVVMVDSELQTDRQDLQFHQSCSNFPYHAFLDWEHRHSINDRTLLLLDEHEMPSRRSHATSTD